MEKVIDTTTGFHFTIIDNYILNYASLNALEQIVYIHLKQHSTYSNKCFPGINKLAEAIGLSPNTVRKILKNLKEKGFVDIKQRYNSSNEYTLLAYPEFIKEINHKALEEKGKGIAMVLTAYQNNINPVFGSMEREKLIMWFEAFEDNEAILIKAIELSVLQGVRKIKYIESILTNWQDNGIKTVEQCEAYQKEWEKKGVVLKVESISKIRERIQKNAMISRNSVTYKCTECCDTGWIETDKNCYKKCICVDLKFIKKCWENYGVKSESVKTLKDYVPHNKICDSAKQKACNYITDFSEIRGKENNWFGVFGQPGSGKSHIAIAIGAAFLNRKNKPIRAVYMPYLEVMRELKANVLDDEYYIKLLNRYQRAEALIIDDLFKDKVKKNKLASELSEVDIKHIYPIINYRYFNKLPTIISSECTPNMLIELDEALGGRILERCDENITVFVGQENNYRLRRFEKN